MSEKKFDLMGSKITWDVATDRYNSLRGDYYLLSQNAQKEAKNVFDEKITSINVLYNSGGSLYEKLFKKYLKSSVRRLVEFEIYDIDEEVLLGIVEARGELKYKSAFNSMINQLDGIDAKLREKKEAGQETVNSLLKTGGELASEGATDIGFGISYDSSGDFASGMLGAAAGAASLLAAGGAALYNNHQNKIAEEEANASKNNVWENEGNREYIFAALAQDVFELYETIGRIVNDRLEDHRYYYYPSEEDLCAIEPICRNIFEGNFMDISEKPDLEKEMIYHVLHVNPYDDRIYSHILMRNGQVTDELKDIISYLNVDMKVIADTYLYRKYSLDEYETYEELCEFETAVDEELETFGIEGCSFHHAFINKKQNLFDIRRTFNGYLYETIEERDKAEKQYDSFFEDGKDIVRMNLDEAIQKYYATLPPEIYPKNREDLQILYMGCINSNINAITTSEMAEQYIVNAEQKRVEYQFVELSLITALIKHKKKLEVKEKMAETVTVAKEKAGAVAGAAKEKGKAFMSKLPFGKKKNAAPEIEAASKPVDIPSPTPAPAPVPVPAPTPAPVPAAQPAVADTKNCPQCGNAVKATAKFCGKCGHHF